MSNLEIILVLLLAAALVQPLASRLDVPLAIAQVLCGLLLAAVPFLRRVEFDPTLTFAVFVTPLLFWASTTGSLRDIRRNTVPIVLLAVCLVLLTAAAVALVAHVLVPSLPWASAFILGSMVAPPDADVTTAIARRIGIPLRLSTILEGETLFNDTAAFLCFRASVGAAVTGSFGLAEAASKFVVITITSVVIGLVIGWLFADSARRFDSSLTVTTMSLLAPFAAFLFAERVGASGVLAVVTTGFYVSRLAPRAALARTRVRVRAVWETVVFLIGGLVFTLIGLQLGRFAPLLWHGGDFSLPRIVGAVATTLIVTRLIWVFGVAYLPRLVRPGARRRGSLPSWRALGVLSWAGLRGGDTLVMVLAVPASTAAGRPLPGRETLVAVGLGVLLATLLLHGLTLRPLIRSLALPRDETIDAEERHARLEAARAALAHIDRLADRNKLPRDSLAYLRTALRQRARLDLDDIEHTKGHDGQTGADALRQFEQALRDVARDVVVRLRDEGVIGQEALRRVQYDLDLDDVRAELDETF